MNRAWIPAGALASVSVAGLIALGPLTDSLGTPVSFQPSVTVPMPHAAHKGTVPVNLDLGTVGRNIIEATVKPRGGQAATQAPTSGDAGQVGFHRPAAPSQPNSVPATVTPSPTTTTKPTTTKKTVKRATSIGATSGPNGDTGLATGGPHPSTGVGEQSSTPGSATP
jgi:hypothetical protein